MGKKRKSRDATASSALAGKEHPAGSYSSAPVARVVDTPRVDQSPATGVVPSDGLRGWLYRLITTAGFERFIIGVILLNALTLGLETSRPLVEAYGATLHALDNAMLAVFVAELLIKIFVYRGQFFRDPWNLFDLVVVGIALAPASGDLAILRAFRILRVLRLITAIPSIKRVVGSLLAAIPSMGSIVALLLIINYVFSVMATKLFGADFEAKFGTLGASFFTFFQIMTLEGWSGEVVRPVMEKFPWAWMFFVPYIVLATFMVLNLFIGIIVDAMNQTADDDRKAQTQQSHDDAAALASEVKSLRREILALREDLGRSARGTAPEGHKN